MLVQKEGSRVAFRDNDGLAALLSIELKADLLVLLTDVDGLFDGPPNDPKSNFIPTYCPEVHDELIKFGDPSAGGRGGMVSKVFCLTGFLSVRLSSQDVRSCLCIHLIECMYSSSPLPVPVPLPCRLISIPTTSWMSL